MFTKPFYNFLLSLFLVLFTAGWCGYFNSFAMDSFYPQIQRSELTPPGYVFSIVWTILYTLMVISLDILLNQKSEIKNMALQLFLFNLFLHIVWSFAFFYCGYFLIGLFVIIIMDVAAFSLVEVGYQTNKLAGVLLLPYLAWILFATYLNWIIYDLNGAAYAF
jgi:tryptophan-rich sensory protein